MSFLISLGLRSPACLTMSLLLMNENVNEYIQPLTRGYRKDKSHKCGGQCLAVSDPRSGLPWQSVPVTGHAVWYSEWPNNLIGCYLPRHGHPVAIKINWQGVPIFLG